jgi:hypothetical protein
MRKKSSPNVGVSGARQNVLCKQNELANSPTADTTQARRAPRRDATVTCAGCGSQFRPERSTARFCSPRCRKSAQRARDRGIPLGVPATRTGEAQDAFLSVTAPVGTRAKTTKCHAEAQTSKARSAHCGRSEMARHVSGPAAGRLALRHGQSDAREGRARGIVEAPMTALPILHLYQTADRRGDRGERLRYIGAQGNPPAHIPPTGRR